MKILFGFFTAVCTLVLFGTICHAEIATDNAFDHAVWNQVYEEDMQSADGVVQSVCATEDYIITIENTNDSPGVPDTVSAYYKNDVDENGNPVVQYSLAKRNSDANWEHGNGMAYNPNTGEIYVALYTHKEEGSRGCIFVMDPHTLTYKRTIKLSDDYNILGIDYIKDKNQYVIQTNDEGGYSFHILDENFNIVEDLGRFADTAAVPGGNFQDLCVSGDYIINFPLTFNLGIGDYIHMYSISKKEMVSNPRLDFRFVNIMEHEPESICEIAPGEFLCAVTVRLNDGSKKYRFYTTEVPYNVTLQVTSDSGSLDEVPHTVRKGTDIPISFTPKEGYELSGVTVNGKESEISDEATEYTVSDIEADTQVHLTFAKIPINMKMVFTVSGITLGVLAVLFVCYAYLLIVRRRKRKLAHRKRSWAREMYRIRMSEPMFAEGAADESADNRLTA